MAAVLVGLFPANVPAARAERTNYQERSERAMDTGIRISGGSNLARVLGDRPLALYTAPDEGCSPPVPLSLMPGIDVITYVLHNGYTAILWNPPGSRQAGILWVHSKGLKATGYGIAPR